jgi:hypothetical protein
MECSDDGGDGIHHPVLSACDYVALLSEMDNAGRKLA